MSLVRRSLVLVALFACFCSAISAGAQAYTSIVVFGDSLCDTGNVAIVSASKYGPAAQVPAPVSGYTLGRFTDGTDTSPAAHNYTGVWVEQLAAQLAAKPSVTASLAGGTNYAYGFATTNTGTTTFTYGPGNALSFPVNNMGQQVASYLATKPVITNKTLFIVWGGANDLINALSPSDITNAAIRDAAIVQTLISAGATDIIVPNLPPLGLVPRFNTSPLSSIPATQEALGFDQALAASLATLPAANPGKTLHIFPLDTYTLFSTLVGPPIGYGFANVTASAQFNSAINPDTYLFWDDLHPTTYGHNVLANTALALIGTPVATTTTVKSSNLNADLKSSVTLTATVTDTTGQPTGSVTFMDGGAVLGTGFLSGSGTTATATFATTSLTATTHSITAVYTGVNGTSSSTSTAISQAVVAPALSAAFNPSSLTIVSGAAGSANLTITTVGGYTGTATFACGTLPAHFSCTFSTQSLALAADTTQSTNLTINTSSIAKSSLIVPARPGAATLPEILSAITLFPCLGFMGFAAFRRRKLLGSSISLMILFATLSAGAILGLTGCSDNTTAGPNPNYATAGTYSVPVAVTANGTTTTATLTVVVQ